MLSRVANSIYWMARYVQRAENIARFLEVTKNFILDQPTSTIAQWEPLVKATGDVDWFQEHYGEFTEASVQQFLTFDRDYHSSILTSITRARENARTVREAISSEAWEQLNVFYHSIKDVSRQSDFRPDAGFYTEIIQSSYTFAGIIDGTMTRTNEWWFAHLGRMLERADKTSRILDVKYFTLLRHVSDVNTTVDDLLWSAVLRSVSAFEMFRKRYHALTVERVVEFLILSPDFPRAVCHSILQLKEALVRIDGPVPHDQNNAIRLATELTDRLTRTDATTIIANGLHEFTDELQTTFNAIGEAIHATYFEAKDFPVAFQQQQIAQ